MVRLEEPAARDWDFPRTVAALGLLVDFGTGEGLTGRQLLGGTGITTADLAIPDLEVTATQELRVIRNLMAGLPAHREAALAVGERYHVSTFGIFGYALMSSRTVLDAMNIGLRFIDLSFTFSIPRASLAGDVVHVEVCDDGLPADVRRFLVERDLAAIQTVFDELIPGGLLLSEATFAFSAPDDPTVHRRVLGVTPRFGADSHTITFDAAYLERPLPQANPQTVALCEQLCRDVVSRRRRRTGITQEVRVLLTQRLAFGAAMDDVAADLGLSTRTLRRRLSEAGTSYQQLLDEVRSSLAEELLATGRLGVEDVALRLGYAEASSFIQAFKRWRGTTPTGYLRRSEDPTGVR